MARHACMHAEYQYLRVGSHRRAGHPCLRHGEQTDENEQLHVLFVVLRIQCCLVNSECNGAMIRSTSLCLHAYIGMIARYLYSFLAKHSSLLCLCIDRSSARRRPRALAQSTELFATPLCIAWPLALPTCLRCLPCLPAWPPGRQKAYSRFSLRCEQTDMHTCNADMHAFTMMTHM
jgi:hypothetical protein